MKSTLNVTGTGNKSTRVGTTHHEKKPVSTVSLVLLGACFVALVAATISLYQEFIATGENGIPTYLLGMFAIAVFLWLSALLALRFSTNTKKAKPSQHKVRAALISSLQTDPDPNVRRAAAKGLSELDVEETDKHLRHADIDTSLIYSLQTDPDPEVRSAAAEGLAEVELEKEA